MRYEIIFFDEMSNECGRHYAQWPSEINVIMNTGLEEGYEVWVKRYERKEELHNPE